VHTYAYLSCLQSTSFFWFFEGGERKSYCAGRKGNLSGGGSEAKAPPLAAHASCVRHVCLAKEGGGGVPGREHQEGT